LSLDLSHHSLSEWKILPSEVGPLGIKVWVVRMQCCEES
jgi:hypothetical protein